MHTKALLLVSLLAATSLATPVKRDLATEVDVEVVTEVVTVTRTGYPAAPTHHLPIHRPKHKHPHHHNRPVPVPAPTYQPQPDPSHKPKPKPTHPNPNLDNYQATVVRHHNVHRANHSAPDIEWDAGLASTAAKIAATCVYEHNTEMDGGGYGQNIAAGVAGNNISEIITGMFYNGEVNAFEGQYNLPDPSGFETWGHFSQVVWKATKYVACATQDCSATGLSGVSGPILPYFTVCNYKNPGNVAGEYGDQVGDSLRKPSVFWNY